MKATALDPLDLRILSALRANGRASYAALGSEIGLSPHGTADRVRRLERAGVIAGYVALVEPSSVGRSLDAFIDVRLLGNAPPDRFEAFIADLPAVTEVAFVTGRFDYHVRVACVDADDLDHTVRLVRAEGAQTETRIVLRATRTQASLHPHP